MGRSPSQEWPLRETVLRAKLASWTDISDVALLKRLRTSVEWLRFLCVELLRENVGYQVEKGVSRTVRIVDGTIVREPGKTVLLMLVRNQESRLS